MISNVNLDDKLKHKYSKGDIKEAIKTAIKEENMRAMQESSKETVRDRLSTYLKNMSLTKVRAWIRFRARAIAGVKGNFRHSHVNNMQCRLCSEGSDETQEHLQLCSGTLFERRGLDMSGRRGLVEFWRRMTVKMAAVT